MRLSAGLSRMSSASWLKPPSSVRGMSLPLDKAAFEVSTSCPGLRVGNREVGKVLGVIREWELRPVAGVKTVQTSDAEHKVVLLDRSRFGESEKTTVEEKMEKIGVNYEFLEHPLKLGFDNFDVEDLVRAVLPPDAVWQRAFTRIGHIVHLNLLRESLPFKAVIGAIFLEKFQPWARTVITKAQEVETKFRTLDMEVIAGEEEFETTSLENGASYRLDLRKVFWNPRQGTERKRLITKFLVPHRSLFFDLCAGIGPFVIPAAKRYCRVFANDLNPDCLHYLNQNIQLNKVSKEVGGVHCLDAAEFVRSVVGVEIRSAGESWEETEKMPSCAHCVINLPGSAVSFLPAFVGCLPAGEKRLPFAVWLHCYTFSKEEARVEGSEEEGNQVSLSFASAILVAERSRLPQSSRAAERRSRVEAEAAARVSAQFPGYQAPYDFKIVESRECRHVSPNKFMVVVSLTLSEQLLQGTASLSPLLQPQLQHQAQPRPQQEPQHQAQPQPQPPAKKPREQ